MIARPSFIALVSVLACGLLYADPGKGSAPPAPPAPPSAPAPVHPPSAPHAPHDPDISITSKDGKIQIGGIQQMVDDQLKNALQSLDNENIPPELRAKLKERLGKLRVTVGNRLGNLNGKDMDKLGEEMEKMGDDISKQMEGFGSDMEKWGDQFGKKFGKDFSRKMQKQLGKLHIDADNDDDDDLGSIADMDDDDDLGDAIHDLADLNLKAPQKDAIAKLRADSDKQAAAAKKSLEAASKQLHDQLENGKASDADIAKSIDAVASQEAAVRKARILAWVQARRVLDDAQRKRVEDAAKGKTK